MPVVATLTGPTSGELGAESTDFTVTLDAAAGPGGVVVLLTSTGASDQFVMSEAVPISPVTLTAGPATFGVTLPAGAATTGVQIGSLSTQTDIKTTWPDGSIRFAILSAVVPSPGTYQVSSSGTNAGIFTPTLPTASAVFTIAGTAWTATLPNTPSTDRWLHGPIAEEARYRVTPLRNSDAAPHPWLRVLFDVRTYAAGGSRVDVTAENCLDVSGSTVVTYDVTLNVNGTPAYTHASVTHYALCRWRKILNTSGLTLSTLTPDFSTAVAIGSLPTYDLSVFTDLHDAAPSGAAYDILGRGIIGSPDMGDPGEDNVRTCLLPVWLCQYLKAGHANDIALMLANGDLAGTWPLHLDMTGTGTPVSIDTYPNFWFDYRATKTVSTGYLGDWTTANMSVNAPEAAHTPSLAYLPYMITGDRYYADEMRYWAAWGLSKATPGYRGGDGSVGYFLSGLGQVRALAWQIRQCAHAATFLPNADPFKAYFATKLQNNLNWVDDTGLNHTGPLDSICTQGDNPSGYNVPLWQYGYLTLAIEHANDLDIPGVSGGYSGEAQMATFFMGILNDPGMATNTLSVGWAFISDAGHTYYTTYAQVVTENGMPLTDPEYSYYSPHNMVLLRVASREGIAGVSSAWTRMYPMAENQYVSWPVHAIKLKGVSI